MIYSKQRMPVIKSRRHIGQFNGSSLWSLGCGTRIMPSLPRLRFALWDRPAVASVKSFKVAVPWMSDSVVPGQVLIQWDNAYRLPGTCSRWLSFSTPKPMAMATASVTRLATCRRTPQ